jgi:hypothetical protein
VDQSLQQLRCHARLGRDHDGIDADLVAVAVHGEARAVTGDRIDGAREAQVESRRAGDEPVADLAHPARRDG